ncbi:GntR family transcriptional regulator [Leisingera methylohalidivorans]|uniref:Transcriptional regulator n=1 Tax=Leisingera methylohalidivorans DSM 14336 TaxID=999552 RepID=V9VSR4_9RHOB|nr:GntR family transcriptional regulator [Leisingera methylohalidivorans]AHD01756.1 transcriptional regulator [Leisingera methylohalidivorans DSM 14336]
MNLDPVDISKAASAAAAVFEALRTAIIDGRLEEGDPLRQEEIARRFNTSRIPVREAISRLEEYGLVKTQRFKGAVVAGLSADEAAEIFDFRALLEPEIIRDAVPRMSQAQLARARMHCEAFAGCKNPMEWGVLNREFHDALYSASALSFFREAARGAMDRVDRYIRAQLVMSDGMERAEREHLEILAACEMGDAGQAAELTRAHVLEAKASLLAHFPVLSRL